MEHIGDSPLRMHISSSPSHNDYVGSSSLENSFGALPTLPTLHPFKGTLTFKSISGVKPRKPRLGVPMPQSCRLLGTTALLVIISTSWGCHIRQRPIRAPDAHVLPSLSIPSTSAEVCIPPHLPPSTVAPILLPIVDSKVDLEDERVVANTMEGVGDFFNIYNNGGLKDGSHLLPSSRARKHIEDLEETGRTLVRRRREWWLGICYSASAVTGIPLDQIQDEDVMEAIKYQGSNDVLRRPLGLDLAI
jgi:hypothetical protein